MLGLVADWVEPKHPTPVIKRALFGKNGKALAGPVQTVRVGPLQIPWAMPTPRGAAVAVLSVLWFGVGVGAASLTAASTVNTLIYTGSNGTVTTVAAVTPTQSTSPATTSPGHTKTNSGGGGTTTTQTTPVTTTATTTTTTSGPTYPNNPKLPPIHNVWVVVLGDDGYSQAAEFPTGDPYLHTLVLQGALVPNYYAVAGSDLANEIAMISGQGPTQQTAENCPKFTNATGTVGTKATLDQFIGSGCVYPDGVPSLPQELSANKFTWKAYIQGLGKSGATPNTPNIRRARKAEARKRARLAAAARERRAKRSAVAAAMRSSNRTLLPMARLASGGFGGPSSTKSNSTTPASETALTCRYPKVGATDPFQSVSAKSGYVTSRNPFVYFDSTITSSTCADQDVGTDQLSGDLKSATTTPNVSFIFPDPCDDGSVTPCVDGAVAGNDPLNKFLQPIVKEIMASPAYTAGGLLLITSAMAPQSGPDADSSSCCGTPSYPNLMSSTTTTTTTTTGTDTTTTGTDTTTTGTDTTTTGTGTGTDTTTTGTGTGTGTTTTPTLPPGINATGGGGRVGLVALSPWIKPITIDGLDTFSHFSLLASIEQLFGLPLTGYSALPKVTVFGPNFYTAFTAT